MEHCAPPPAARDARFDMVRIVAMLMIIFGHCVFHGIRGVTGSDATATDPVVARTHVAEANLFLCQLLTYASIIGPNLFMLITGYFLISPRPVSYALRKTLSLWLDIVLYAAGIYLISVAFGGVEFSLRELGGYLAPVHEGVYWFLTVYIAVLLLSPFLAGAARLPQRDYIVMLGVLLLLNFAQEGVGYGHIFSGGMSVFFFIFLFLTGGYIRLYDVPAVVRRHSGKAWVAMCVALTLLSVLPVLEGAGGEMTFHVKGMANNSLPFFMSVFCFVWLINIPVPGVWVSRAVTAAAPCILGVYLIHEHPVLRRWLWHGITDVRVWVGEWWFVPAALGGAVAILVACILIDALRRTIGRKLSAK